MRSSPAQINKKRRGLLQNKESTATGFQVLHDDQDLEPEVTDCPAAGAAG